MKSWLTDKTSLKNGKITLSENGKEGDLICFPKISFQI